MHDLDFRITDIQRALFFSRKPLGRRSTMHEPKEEFDLWHPAEGRRNRCSRRAGDDRDRVDGLSERYAKGIRILLHASSDTDGRVAAIVAWTAAR